MRKGDEDYGKPPRSSSNHRRLTEQQPLLGVRPAAKRCVYLSFEEGVCVEVRKEIKKKELRKIYLDPSPGSETTYYGLRISMCKKLEWDLQSRTPLQSSLMATGKPTVVQVRRTLCFRILVTPVS
uniref:Uncharacterized protein n=1 Tax=Myotis myotis TaxID=51298 RepID=A0A7J7S269_MYOMY|nr:hypothetical protein mMyoMyo1_010105 [Myotis myotis]